MQATARRPGRTGAMPGTPPSERQPLPGAPYRTRPRYGYRRALLWRMQLRRDRRRARLAPAATSTAHPGNSAATFRAEAAPPGRSSSARRTIPATVASVGDTSSTATAPERSVAMRDSAIPKSCGSARGAGWTFEGRRIPSIRPRRHPRYFRVFRAEPVPSSFRRRLARKVRDRGRRVVARAREPAPAAIRYGRVDGGV